MPGIKDALDEISKLNPGEKLIYTCIAKKTWCCAFYVVARAPTRAGAPGA
jgi:hypothetical protein